MELIKFLKILKSKGNLYHDIWWKLLSDLESEKSVKVNRRLDISKTQYYRIIKFGLMVWEEVVPELKIKFIKGNLILDDISGVQKTNPKPKNKTEKNNENGVNMSEVYESIISYLNLKANTKYQSTTKSYQTLINSKIKSGFGLEDFYEVVDNKCNEWIGTDFQKFLRPETLFGSKFETYLNQKINNKTNQEKIYDKVSEATKLGWGN